MRSAIHVSDLLKDEDLDALKQHVFGPYQDEDGIDCISYDPHPKRGPSRSQSDREISVIVEDVERDEELEKLLREGDVGTVARAYLLAQINERTEKHTCSRLQINPNTKKLERHDTAKNLLGCIWLQMSNDVDSNRKYDKCKHCGDWFELLPRRRRDHTVYCSRNCRMAAYRERQEEARRLRARGMKYRDIAKRLGSEVETVRGWVEGRR